MSNIVEIIKTVFGWMVKHKVITIIGAVIISFVVLSVMASKHQQSKANERNALEEDGGESVEGGISEYEQEQELYIQRYGEPKEGFRWNEDGELIPIGSIGKTQEDVIFTYLRSLTTLDFANAQRFSYKTEVVKQYQRFFDTESDFSYNNTFRKGMYKQVLLSMKPNRVVDLATFANYKAAVTMNIEIIDLTNKDFWLKDKDKLFEELKKYRVVERDATKMKEFLFNYVLEYYQTPTAKTRDVNVNFVMEQTLDGAWLITNDNELDAIAQYQDGELVVDQILSEFDDWISFQELPSRRDEDFFDGTTDNADELLDHGSFEEEGVIDYKQYGENN